MRVKGACVCVCVCGRGDLVRTHTHSDTTCFCDCWPLPNEVMDELFSVCCVLCVWLMTSAAEWGAGLVWLGQRRQGVVKQTHTQTHTYLWERRQPRLSPQEIVGNKDLVAVVMVYKEAGWPRSEVTRVVTDLHLHGPPQALHQSHQDQPAETILLFPLVFIQTHTHTHTSPSLSRAAEYSHIWHDLFQQRLNTTTKIITCTNWMLLEYNYTHISWTWACL